eukprot:scaffold56914_cov63-Phaeocystis_antarctica.AAC.5
MPTLAPSRSSSNTVSEWFDSVAMMSGVASVSGSCSLIWLRSSLRIRSTSSDSPWRAAAKRSSSPCVRSPPAPGSDCDVRQTERALSTAWPAAPEIRSMRPCFPAFGSAPLSSAARDVVSLLKVTLVGGLLSWSPPPSPPPPPWRSGPADDMRVALRQVWAPSAVFSDCGGDDLHAYTVVQLSPAVSACVECDASVRVLLLEVQKLGAVQN